MNKKVFAIIAVVAVLIGVMCIGACAETKASGTLGTNITWVYDDESYTLTVSGTGEMADASLFGGPWSAYSRDLRTIVVGEGITSIGENVFAYCDVSTLELPTTLKTISSYAFSDTRYLRYVKLPASVTTIEAYAFDGSDLRRIFIPSQTKTIDEKAFDNTVSELVIMGYSGSRAQSVANSMGVYFECLNPSGTTTVASGSVKTGITWKIDSIGRLIISGTGELPDYSSGYKQPWYEYKDQIKKIEIGSGITKIGNIFDSLDSVSTVIIPNTVKEIGPAFEYCDNLNFVSIPPSVEVIDPRAFYSSTYLHIEGYKYTAAYDFAQNELYTFISLGEEPYEIIASGSMSSTISWKVDNRRVLTISGTGKMPDQSSSSSEPWIEYAARIETINIEEGITYIGKYTLSSMNYKDVYYINLPETLTEIGKGALSLKYSWLKKIYMPPSLIKIDSDVKSYYGNLQIEGYTYSYAYEYALEHDIDFVSVGEMPYEIYAEGEIGNGTWKFDNRFVLTITGTGEMPDYTAEADVPWTSYKKKIRRVVIEGNLTNIGGYYFSSMANITSIELPQTVKEIGNNAFSNCTLLKEVIADGTLEKIGDYAFYECSAIRSVPMGEGLKEIGNYAFSETAYSSFSAPSTLEKIGDGAFEGVSTCVSVTINENIQSIGKYAFSGLTQLKSVTIPKTVTMIPEGLFSGCSTLKTVDLHDDITTIGDKAFLNTKVVISQFPSKLKTIGSQAFSGTSFVNLIIPEGIEEIGSEAFSSSILLKSVKIPSTVKKIGDGAFKSSMFLNSVEIANGVEQLGANVFASCSYLTSVNLPESLTSIGSGAFSGCSKLTAIEIPPLVTEIKAYTFQNCSAITDFKLHENITSIGVSAFYNALSDCSITMGEKVTDVGKGAFERSKIKEIIFKDGEGITFGESVFAYCTKLETVVLPKGLETIPTYTFDSASSLVSVTIPDTVNVIDERAFDYCTKLESITIPGSVKTIRRQAFYDCSGLKKVVMEQGVESILYAAFSACSSLSEITIPYSVISIGNYSIPVNAEGLTVYGYTYSIAEYYANENTTEDRPITFVSLGEMPDMIIASGTSSDRVDWTVSSRGVFTLGGEGNYFTRMYGTEWSSFEGYIKKIVMGENIHRVADVNEEYYPNLEEIVTHYNLLKTKTLFTELGENVVIYGYTNSGADRAAKENNLNFVSIGTMPEGDILSFEWENVKWSMDGYGKLTLVADGIVPTPTYYANYPWYGYSGCINEIVIGEGITSIDNRAYNLSNFPNVTKMTVHHNMTDFSAAWLKTNVVVYAYKYSQAATSAEENGREVVYIDIMPEEVVGEGSCGEDMSWTLTNYGILTIKGEGEMTSAPWVSNKVKVRDALIPEGVTSICEGAFKNSLLTEIHVPNSVEVIGEGAFLNCTSLEKVWLGTDSTSKLDVLQANVFSNCTSLTHIQIPTYIKEITSTAFYGCENLEYVHYTGRDWRWNSDITGIENVPEDATILFQSNLPENVSLTVTSITKTTKEITVVVEAALQGGDGAFIATYDNEGTMTSIVNIVPGTDTYSVDRKAKTVKVFLWNSTDSLVPVNNVYVKEF